ncbi:FAD-dependent oxidoreductase [Kitasatospora herbaricolor]|uniref:FAD-dependent monooxygenase n=1 Tax=Kitasatospora herbaricolor TaxID=68217 RepID=UPI00174A3DAC|nr:FAD-dependent monooxygenase [Kitasatospora herbaricolor]MDQ0306297.1 2-polyprenyl-6-methoxyphenol hydroxylase-like FAD-dependent oxidoreductase [Kitasatospora herbaricolor]GGV42958.1 FAD-dependent oxidoreductase [Kitasatospora herbaricolor]
MTLDVLIAGAGPNGLMLACELSLAGVRPVVLELLPERSAEPKANGLVGQAVRLLDHRGLHEALGGGPGAPRPVPHYVFGAFTLDLTGLDPNPVTILPVQQRRLEQQLEERAVALGVEIRRGHRLVALTGEHGDGDPAGEAPGPVTVDVEGPGGRYRLHADYLVGCDGGRSTVRKLAGIAFPGVTGPDLVSRTGHVTLPEALLVPESGELDIPGFGRLRPFTHTRTERGVVVFAAPEPGKPLLSTLEWGPPPAGEDGPMTLAELRASVGRVLGVELPVEPPTSPGPHLLRRITGGNTRLAERYRRGRVLLAGDAAHVHSAVGGPGLNLGLQDAANLGWKLAATVRGWAPPGLLDTYHAERHPVGERVFIHSQAQLALMAPGEGVTALRGLFAELLADTANVQHIADTLAGSDVRYATTCAHPLAGRFAPDADLETAAGPIRLAELMRGGRPLLLDLTGGAGLPAATAAPWKDRVDMVTAGCAAPPAAALLIRPDGYVAWAAAAGEPDGQLTEGLRTALAAWFGAPAAA